MSRNASAEGIQQQRGSISSGGESGSSLNLASSSRRDSANSNIDGISNATRNLAIDEELLAKTRDAELVRILKEALGGNERRFEEFRQLSVKFRNYDIDCPKYIQSFVGIFGLEKATQVFPSLLDSFPDRERRSNLLECFNRQEQMVSYFNKRFNFKLLILILLAKRFPRFKGPSCSSSRNRKQDCPCHDN